MDEQITPSDQEIKPRTASQKITAGLRPADEETESSVLAAEELEAYPVEQREAMTNIHKQIDAVFRDVGVKVDESDPEWIMIQAEWTDEHSTLERTLLAAREAAQVKAARVKPMTAREKITAGVRQIWQKETDQTKAGRNKVGEHYRKMTNRRR